MSHPLQAKVRHVARLAQPVRWPFGVGWVAAAILVSTAAAQTASVLIGDAVGNHHVLLVSAKVSETRGQNLMATFAVVDGPKDRIVTVQFPCHSFTTHESTLMTVIRSCIDWTEPKDAHLPHKAKCNAVFSVPKDAEGYVTSYEHWWLVSLAEQNTEPLK